MAHEYMFVGLLMAGALLLALAALGLAWIVRPHKGHGAKTATYECGMEVIGGAWVQFRVGYYIYALLFVLFDVEAALLLPWAVAYRTLPLYTLLEVTLFLLILLAGAVWAWRTGALRWS